MSSFQGQVIAIPGAAPGIGLAVAKHLASTGAKLSLTDSSQDAPEEAANSIGAEFGQDRPFHHVADVRDAAAVHVWIEKTASVFGRLDGAERSTLPVVVTLEYGFPSLTSGANASACATSKHAVIRLTRAAAMDAAPYGMMHPREYGLSVSDALNTCLSLR
ncbi:Levodione reductase [Colletotrichum shisoi]|uniref:Levodione reductase n=1 Tax=Colletotrichum shisoi TaxID=2078593 RepID=A0A5Q4BAV0_9PEZI|nr:Levodione reductase [Colletotrichum shisoi]